MTQNQEISRSNISLTGDGSKLLRELQVILQAQHEPVNISLADVVVIALTKLKAEIASQHTHT